MKPEDLRQQEISSEQIAQRAYEIWDGAGRPSGRDQEHWLMAEQELRSRKRADSGRTVRASRGERKTSNAKVSRKPRSPKMPGSSKLPRSARIRSGKRA